MNNSFAAKDELGSRAANGVGVPSTLIPRRSNFHLSRFRAYEKFRSTFFSTTELPTPREMPRALFIIPELRSRSSVTATRIIVSRIAMPVEVPVEPPLRDQHPTAPRVTVELRMWIRRYRVAIDRSVIYRLNGSQFVGISCVKV